MSVAIANQLFLAYMGRPADVQWRSSTASLLNGNQPSAALQTAFYNAAVSEGVFATADSNSTLVNKIFLQIFGFSASSFEQTAWGNLINNGTMTAGTAAWTIFSSYLGATNVPDAYKLPAQSKLIAVNAYTNQLANDPASNLALSQGGGASTIARSFTSGVNSQATAAIAVTNIASTVAGLSTAQTGTTFTLTIGADNIVGTANNDLINGVLVDDGAVGTTLNVADAIAGGTGIDTLALTVTGTIAATGIPAATISGVEVFRIRDVNTGGGSTYDFNTVVGETGVVNAISTQSVTFNNIGAGASLSILGDGSTVNGPATIFTTASGTQALTINLEGGVNGSPVLARLQTGNAPITINSTGAATTNSLALIDLDTGASLTGLTINAATRLNATLGADYAANATLTLTGAGNIDLTGSTVTTGTGVVTAFGATALDANFATVTASATSGGVSVISGASTTTITGGSGNDVISAGGAVYGGSAKLDGGAGTGDVIVVENAAQLTAATAANFSNFEILRLASDNAGDVDSFSASQISGLTGLEVGANVVAGDATTITNISANLSGAIAIQGSQTGGVAAGLSLGVAGATAVGQLDTLAIRINDGLAAKNTIVVDNITAAGVETVNFAATDNFTLSGATGLTALTAMNVTGAGNVNITTGALAINVNTVVNASALTGTFAFNAGASTTNNISVTGSATKANTITTTAFNDIINGGSAADNLVAGAGNDVVNAGAGNDFVSGDAGADTMTLGDGNDTVAFAGTGVTQSAAPGAQTSYAIVDRITDFVGNGSSAGDTIQLETGANVFGAALQFIAGGGTTATVTAVTIATAADFTTLAAGVQAASAGVASANAVAQVYDVTVTAGNLAGRVMILNNDTAIIDTTDTFINLTGITGALNAQDFTFV